MKVNIYIASDLNEFRAKDGHAGYIIEDDLTKATITRVGKVENATKNKGELLVLKNALTRIKTECEVTLYIDNFFIKNAWSQGWTKTWTKNGFKTKKDKDLADKEEWQAVIELLAGRTPEIITGTKHEYKSWLITEINRRSKNVR